MDSHCISTFMQVTSLTQINQQKVCKTELFDLVGFNPAIEIVFNFCKKLNYNVLSESALSNADFGFKFFKDRFFFEPAIGCSYWPLRTGVPDSFKEVEKIWPNYFIQPGLDFGFKF